MGSLHQKSIQIGKYGCVSVLNRPAQFTCSIVNEEKLKESRKVVTAAS